MKITPPSLVNVAALLLIGAVLFQAGREVGRLEGLSGPAVAGRGDAGTDLVHSSFVGPHPKPVLPEAPQPASSGDPPGTDEIITPLNVRDPSALVMGPGPSFSCPPALTPPSMAPPEPKPRFEGVKPPPQNAPDEGRLLDLLKKKGADEKDPDAPKNY